MHILAYCIWGKVLKYVKMIHSGTQNNCCETRLTNWQIRNIVTDKIIAIHAQFYDPLSSVAGYSNFVHGMTFHYGSGCQTSKILSKLETIYCQRQYILWNQLSLWRCLLSGWHHFYCYTLVVNNVIELDNIYLSLLLFEQKVTCTLMTEMTSHCPLCSLNGIWQSKVTRLYPGQGPKLWLPTSVTFKLRIREVFVKTRSSDPGKPFPLLLPYLQGLLHVSYFS